MLVTVDSEVNKGQSHSKYADPPGFYNFSSPSSEIVSELYVWECFVDLFIGTRILHFDCLWLSVTVSFCCKVKFT